MFKDKKYRDCTPVRNIAQTSPSRL